MGSEQQYTTAYHILGLHYILYFQTGCTLQSVIIGKRLLENAPACRTELGREFKVQICNNYAPLCSEEETVAADNTKGEGDWIANHPEK